MARRCLDCGALFGTPHEIWCQSKNAEKERAINERKERRAEIQANDGSTPFAWHPAWYDVGSGPLPTMNVIVYGKRSK